jgi:predicted amidohydrolase YtcJ
MEADIAVWDNNMYTFPSAEPRNLKCLMTIYRVPVVYQSQ